MKLDKLNTTNTQSSIKQEPRVIPPKNSGNGYSFSAKLILSALGATACIATGAFAAYQGTISSDPSSFQMNSTLLPANISLTNSSSEAALSNVTLVAAPILSLAAYASSNLMNNIYDLWTSTRNTNSSVSTQILADLNPQFPDLNPLFHATVTQQGSLQLNATIPVTPQEFVQQPDLYPLIENLEIPTNATTNSSTETTFPNITQFVPSISSFVATTTSNLTTKLDQLWQSTITLTSPVPPENNPLATKEHSKCLDPYAVFQERFETGTFEAISKAEMQQLFGSERILSDEEARALYNRIAKANQVFGLKALTNFDHIEDADIARRACEIRHASRVYVRSVGPEQSQEDAEYLDYIRTGSITGLSCEEITRKYFGDWEKIVTQAGKPNPKVTGMISYIPQNQMIRRAGMWVGVNTGLI